LQCSHFPSILHRQQPLWHKLMQRLKISSVNVHLKIDNIIMTCNTFLLCHAGLSKLSTLAEAYQSSRYLFVFRCTHSGSVFLLHEAFEHIENTVKSLWSIDVVELPLPHWRTFLAHHRHLLDECGIVLHEMPASDIGHVEYSNLSGHDDVVVASHQNIVHHRCNLHHILD
jgi:hypothetical protein